MNLWQLRWVMAVMTGISSTASCSIVLDVTVTKPTHCSPQWRIETEKRQLRNERARTSTLNISTQKLQSHEKHARDEITVTKTLIARLAIPPANRPPGQMHKFKQQGTAARPTMLGRPKATHQPALPLPWLPLPYLWLIAHGGTHRCQKQKAPRERVTSKSANAPRG